MQKIHDEYQPSGVQYLKSRGLSVMDGTYHNYKSDDEDSDKMAKTRLQRNEDITSLYIRAFADNIAINDKVSFLVDWKTQEDKREPDKGQRIPNFSIEALQYAFHYHLSKLGIKILYVLYDPFYNVEKRFFVNPDKPWEIVKCRVFFPPYCFEHPERKKMQEEVLIRVFGKTIKDNFHPHAKGTWISRDPYFLIPADKVERQEKFRNGQ